jgi:hypothetical protein
MCTTKVLNYTLCTHSTREIIPCYKPSCQWKDLGEDNVYNVMHHRACPKCSGITFATTKTDTSSDLTQAPGPSSTQGADDLVDLPSSRGTSRMSSIKRLMRAVSTKTQFRKSSYLEGTRRGPAVPVPVPMEQPVELSQSEQLAEEYRSLLDVHPLLRESSFEALCSRTTPWPDIETGTTWSGLMSGAMGAGVRKGWYVG